MEINIIGSGLAGSQAALCAAKQNVKVNLFEMRPKFQTGAHKTSKPAELVCSNSLGSLDLSAASGLLKEELKILNSDLIFEALNSRVPAGNALAVDRNEFSARIENLLLSNPNIKIINEKIDKIPEGITLIATGPLTDKTLSDSIKSFTGEEHFEFFDAVAPIVEISSINFDKAFRLNRYGKGSPDYINCPMNKEEYLNFYDILINAPKADLKEFEKGAKFFESCLPVEVIASRGIDTLRFGPMKPVGLVDPRTNAENYAVVQLRIDDKSEELCNIVGFQTNLKFGAQKELVHSIPGLENANIVRYGVMHANTFINSPKILLPTLQTRKRTDLFFAGQITGTEGYTESITSGLLAGINAARLAYGKSLLTLPKTTVSGALFDYICFEGHKSFQPVNSNWGIIDKTGIDRKILKNKKTKSEFLAKRAIEDLKNYLKEFVY